MRRLLLIIVALAIPVSVGTLGMTSPAAAGNKTIIICERAGTLDNVNFTFSHCSKNAPGRGGSTSIDWLVSDTSGSFKATISWNYYGYVIVGGTASDHPSNNRKICPTSSGYYLEYFSGTVASSSIPSQDGGKFSMEMCDSPAVGRLVKHGRVAIT